MTDSTRISTPRAHYALCPKCKVSGARRSHRRGIFERIWSKLTHKVPFRCAECKHRFWKRVDPRDI